METTSSGIKLITIGELSEMFSLSKRTLRMYHEIGLLIPEYIDERTGYRYYTPNQFPQVTAIIQMRALGLSLNNIRTLLEMQELNTCETLFGERLDELNKEIAELTTVRNSLIRQINSCKHLRHPPTLGQVSLEYFPQRSGLIFDIESYNFLDSVPGKSPWIDALNLVRNHLMEKAPSALSYFQKIGCLVKQDALEERKWLCSQAFILDDTVDRGLPWFTMFPAGSYLCIYRKYTAMDGWVESKGIEEMLTYIKDHNYEIIGPYMGEVIAEASVIACNDQTILVRQQIHVQQRQ